jgi:pilus assembly protein Flp/PilA
LWGKVTQTKGGEIMEQLLAGVKNFWCEEEGATAVEYAVMLALIIVVCILVIQTLGQKVKNTFNNVQEHLNG